MAKVIVDSSNAKDFKLALINAVDTLTQQQAEYFGEALKELLPIATQNSAEAGTSADLMTALRVKQSISANAASKAQGDKADSAVQSSSLATIATSGAYSDLQGIPPKVTSISEIAVAKGDLLVAASTSAFGKLPIGEQGAVIMANAFGLLSYTKDILDLVLLSLQSPGGKSSDLNTALRGILTVATKEQAEGGTGTGMMTAQRVKEAIAALALSIDSISQVGRTGQWEDILSKPSFVALATSGAWADVSGKPAFATVATSGAYADLSGKPPLAAVAISGAYADLSGAPAPVDISGKLNKAGDSMSGALNMQDQQLTRALMLDHAIKGTDVGTVSGAAAQAFDLEVANYQIVTLASAATPTFSFTHPAATGNACSLTLEVITSAGGTITWPVAVAWDAGVAPTIPAAGTLLLGFITRNAGTSWRGFVIWSSV